MVVGVGGRRGRGGAAGGLGPLLGLLGPGGILEGSWEVAAASWNELELDSHWMLEYTPSPLCCGYLAPGSARSRRSRQKEPAKAKRLVVALELAHPCSVGGMEQCSQVLQQIASSLRRRA